MRTMRVLIALAICSVTLVAGTGVASAGISPVTATLVGVCSPSTGLYDVTLTLEARELGGATLTEGVFEATDAEDADTGSGLLTFVPATLDTAGATGVASFSVGGTTTLVYTEWEANGFFETEEIALDGTCTTTPTTPTTPTTTAPGETPTTEAPVAAAAVASPRFTG